MIFEKMPPKERYHCCATCRHFQAEKKDGKMSYVCTRLGYHTKPNYKFNCWNPREDIKKKMERI